MKRPTFTFDNVDSHMLQRNYPQLFFCIISNYSVNCIISRYEMRHFAVQNDANRKTIWSKSFCELWGFKNPAITTKKANNLSLFAF